ncbi:MAG: GxxExxY protein, partial [Planctomycetes bacterium]|nr:GxxExxY protein [Planctomycetota bacterium]
MFKDKGYKSMGAAFEVYNQFGYGMAEETSKKASNLNSA